MAVQAHSDPGFDYAELLARCEEKIGYRFSDRSLLKAALTHASGAEHRLASNERLEFFGDAILGAVVCEALYRRFPDYLEGELTRIKSMVVSRRTCAKTSKKIGLTEFLILGKGMTNHTELPNSLLSDVFESLVAAIYLDGGSETARDFIHRHLDDEIDAAAEAEHGGNYKSLLQQLAQRDFGSTPVYQLLDEKGPDHSKCFQVSAQVAGNRFHPAWGSNKKEAEQRAACNALCELRDEPAPFPV
ncbi:MAG: ribonuclease III [Pirellulales bacterium]|nr:ribonuclease III [Planctomycetales bacterium]